MVTLAGGLSPPVGTQSTPEGGHRGHRAHPGVLAHPPPPPVPQAQAVLYLIDRLIISSLELHIGFR